MDFNTMLEDIYNNLETKPKSLLVLPNPIIERGTTRVIWRNIKDFLKVINTPPQHLFTFISSMTNHKINWFSESISEGLIIHNQKINVNDISGWMKKYVNDYIICRICKQTNTKVMKNILLKKYYIHCSSCNSEYVI